MNMNKNPGLWIVLTGGLALWLIYDIATPTEAPNGAVAVMQWVFLIGLLVGLVGAIVQFIKQKREDG